MDIMVNKERLEEALSKITNNTCLDCPVKPLCDSDDSDIDCMQLLLQYVKGDNK